MKLKDVVFKGVGNKPKDSWPTYDGKELDRSKFVTSSEIGKCSRMIWFAKYAAEQDIPPPKGDNTGWGYWERGHNVEAWVVEQLHRANVDADFLYTGREQVSFYDGHQSGTPDGLMLTDEGTTVFDIKSIDPRKGVKTLPDPSHIKQVVQNADLIRACTSYVPSKGKLIYVNCSNYEHIYEYDFDLDSADFIEMSAELEARAEFIMSAETADEVEPEGIFNNGCAFKYEPITSGFDTSA